MIQLYHLKRTPDVQKAERYFKERRIAYQTVDLTKHAFGPRELQSVAAAVGLKNLVDEASTAWKESTLQFLHDPQTLIAELCRHPKYLRFPIVRNGKAATVGHAPDVWAAWAEK